MSIKNHNISKRNSIARAVIFVGGVINLSLRILIAAIIPITVNIILYSIPYGYLYLSHPPIFILILIPNFKSIFLLLLFPILHKKHAIIL